MNDIFDEAKEALERDKVSRLWHENKYYIIFSIAFIILFTASVNAYRSWNTSQYEKDTAILLDVLQTTVAEGEEKSGEQLAIELDTIAPDLRPAHKATALFGAFTEYAKTDQVDKALNNLNAVYKDNSIEQDIRDYAIIVASGYYIDNIDFVSNKDFVDELRIKLESVAMNHASPWQSKALLNCALWEMYLDEDAFTAISYLDRIINNEDLPESRKKKGKQCKACV